MAACLFFSKFFLRVGKMYLEKASFRLRRNKRGPEKWVARIVNF